MATKQPLIVLVGQTASGKTALAIDIAQKINGEVICADSRTVVASMDIGTAKPSAHEQASVPHWGLDLVSPNEQYTAGLFQRYVQEKAAEIRARGRVPMLVGGTGLYVDGVVFDYEFPSPMTEQQRLFLSSMSTDDLHKYCIEHNIELPENDKNKRHLIRAIAHKTHADTRLSHIVSDTFMFGIVVSTTTVHERIHERTQAMFRSGVIDEAQKILSEFGGGAIPSFDGVYPGMREYFDGTISKADVRQKFELRDRQLAKRQMTWFRRNPYIAWGTPNDIADRVSYLFTPE